MSLTCSYESKKILSSEISLIKTIPPAKLSFSSRSTIFLASRSLHSLVGELHSLEGGGSRPDYDVHLHNKLMPAQQEGEGERTSHLDPPLRFLLRAAGQHKLNNKVQLSRHGRINISVSCSFNTVISQRRCWLQRPRNWRIERGDIGQAEIDLFPLSMVRVQLQQVDVAGEM